jgi:CRP/FNR family transcriptional regulator, cyclic AMP receptor protein
MDERKVGDLELFSGLSKADRRQVAQMADEVEVDEGRRLVDEGAFAYEFFVVVEGSAGVTRGGEHVADLGPGDFLGEMGIVGRTKRNASVVATSPMTLLVMTGQGFRSLRHAMPGVAGRIEQVVEERSASLVC